MMPQYCCKSRFHFNEKFSDFLLLLSSLGPSSLYVVFPTPFSIYLDNCFLSFLLVIGEGKKDSFCSSSRARFPRSIA